MKRLLAAAGVAALLGGCFGDPRVVRIYDGHVVEGTYVPPEAYAHYLRGVLAEEGGNLKAALEAYALAARYDDEDPEPLARLADVECKIDPRSRAADEALRRALRIDPSYAGALAVKARCELVRGDAAGAVATVDRVEASDRSSAKLEAISIRAAAQTSADARARAIALTAAHAGEPAAWEALLAWGRARGDVELVARGLEGLGRAAPTRVAEVEAGVGELVAIGELGLARRVSATVADAPAWLGERAVRSALVARLAVDEALARADRSAALRRAVRGHVAQGEVAARALLLEQRGVAAEIVAELVAADPDDGCARGVIAVVGGGAAPAAFASSASLPVACVVVVGERLALHGGSDTARTWVDAFLGAPSSDPLTDPAVVELAARGALGEATLSPALRIELAARRRETPPNVDVAALDARHALLYYALTAPGGPEAGALLRRLMRAAERDSIVGFALARTAIAASSAVDWGAVERALAAAPSHPLLLAAAVDVAKRAGKTEAVTPARVRLMAVARTPAERALAAE